MDVLMTAYGVYAVYANVYAESTKQFLERASGRSERTFDRKQTSKFL